jgi:hypothetical protein
MTTKRNGKQAPFQIGQQVHHISADRIVRTVLWVSKGATNRAEQVIATDYDASNTVQADIYVEAA